MTFESPAPARGGLRTIVDRQHDVVTRAQLVAHGYSARFARSRVESGRWRAIHPGVYVTHSGPVSWNARAWAALLAAGRGAALCFESAAYLEGLVTPAPRVVDVMVPHDRNLRPITGARLHRMRHERTVGGSPPHTALWATAIDLADRATSDDDVVGILTRAVRLGMPVELLRSEAASRPRLHRRALIRDVLTEVREGVESPLELRYRRDVERAHGLPRGRRQKRVTVDGGRRRIRADVVYGAFGLHVELDGVLGHPGGTTDDDVWRDNAVAVERHRLTLRYRWSHVVGRRCAAAGQVALALRQRGWTGTPRQCGPRCPID